MKKILTTISLALVVLIIGAALTVGTAATEAFANQENYAKLGQDVFSTDSNFKTSSIIIDGVLERKEGWVCVTPNGVDLHLTEAVFKKKSSDVLVVDKTLEAHKELMPKTKYYVAQDDNYVYLAIQQVENLSLYEAINEKVKLALLTYVRLGFNPNDCSQQLVLYSSGQFKTTSQEKAPFPAWEPYPLEVFALTNNNKFVAKNNENTKIIEKDYFDSRMKITSKDNAKIRTYEVKLSKEAIKEQYTNIFGTEASANIDFSVMFIGVSGCNYTWVNGGPVSDYSFVNGTVVSKDVADANSVNTFLLDAICFTEAQEETASIETNASTETDKAPTSENKGCGGTVSLVGTVVVATLGCCAGFALKKKEE